MLLISIDRKQVWGTCKVKDLRKYGLLKASVMEK
jgi:hypothetical protein